MKCYVKPNRKTTRKFTANDVQRIARYAIDDGADALEILGYVAISAGFGYVFCRAARAIDTATSLSRVVVKVAGILAVSKLVDFLLTVVTRGAFARLPVINKIAASIVLAVGISEGILKLARDFLADEQMIVQTAELTHRLCAVVKEKLSEGGEGISALYDDTIDVFD